MIPYPWVHHHHPHGPREMGNPLLPTFSCPIKKSGPRSQTRVLPSVLLRHSMINPVSSLYSFLRPSCFLDWARVPCRHHQAQFSVVQRTFGLYDLSMTSFSGSALSSAGFAQAPANQVSPTPENMAGGIICVYRKQNTFLRLSVPPCNSPLI